MKRNFIHVLLSALAAFILMPRPAVCAGNTDFPAMVKKFSADRRRLAERLSKQLDIQQPNGMKDFFDAAEQRRREIEPPPGRK